MQFDKRKAYAAFREALPPALQDDRFFKIFYSDIVPSDVLVIGLNPGGDPGRPETIDAASLFFERGEHDYVDCDYKLARKMRELFERAGLATSADAIRRIPKINVVFHRSPGASANAGWTWPEAVRASQSLVGKILEYVRPTMVIFEGVDAYKKLLTQQGWSVRHERDAIPKHVKVAVVAGPSWTDTIAVIVLAHPTGFRWSAENWSAASRILRDELNPGRTVAPTPPLVRRKTPQGD